MKGNHKLSDRLAKLLEKASDDSMTLGAFIESVGPQGQALLTLIFSLPFVVIFSLPGVSNLFGILVLVLGARLAINKSVWIPKRFKSVKIGGPKFSKIFKAVCKLISWIEKFTRPRWSWMFSWKFSHFFLGLMIAIDGLCLALPLPPGTGVPAALAASALSLGLLEKDGLWILIGTFLFFLNLAFVIFLLWYSTHIIADMLVWIDFLPFA